MKSGLARQDSSYRWVSPRGTKRVGTHEIIVVVVVVVVVPTTKWVLVFC